MRIPHAARPACLHCGSPPPNQRPSQAQLNQRGGERATANVCEKPTNYPKNKADTPITCESLAL